MEEGWAQWPLGWMPMEWEWAQSRSLDLMPMEGEWAQSRPLGQMPMDGGWAQWPLGRMPMEGELGTEATGDDGSGKRSGGGLAGMLGLKCETL